VLVTTYWLERVWTGIGPVQDGVVVEVQDGVFTRVSSGSTDGPPEDAERLVGLTIPGLANCHSHAFHRALRGRTQRGRGTFWTWREQMYDVASRLTPDSYFELARATYREMVLGGVTSVGEFHYLHHGRDGTPYDDPNAMSHALVAAAHEAGLRIALLDTCYLASGIGSAPEGVQLRFSDGDAGSWAERVQAADLGPDARLGAAIHSVRAVPREEMWQVTGWAEEHRAPLHVHLSEQVAENVACQDAYGATPTEILEDAGALGSRTSAVHATHLGDPDIDLLGGSGTHACFCPTTERDLGDGIGPSRRLHDAGAPLTLGSDSHAVVDLFEEMRAVELDERLATQTRGHWTAAELLIAATYAGHRSLGFGGVGRIEVGGRADLVTLDTTSVRTAGTGADDSTAVFATAGADVVSVIRDGMLVATAGDRQAAGADLDRVVRSLWED
jgi:formiminoglutamate deiminase